MTRKTKDIYVVTVMDRCDFNKVKATQAFESRRDAEAWGFDKCNDLRAEWEYTTFEYEGGWFDPQWEVTTMTFEYALEVEFE